MALILCNFNNEKAASHLSLGSPPAGKAEEEQDFIGLFEAKANKLAPERWRLRVL